MRKKIYLLAILIVTSSFMLGQTYKVMSYNIRYDNPNDGENQWSKRKTYLCDQISFYSPDIFGIQEGLNHQTTYIDNTLTNYAFVGVGRDDGKKKGEFSAIFYNTQKFKVLKEGTFWLSETPNKISIGWDASMERICTYALIEDLKNKQKFFVFNTHFDHRGDKARIESANLIFKKITEFNQNNIPVILMGDLNLTPESQAIKYFSKVLNDSRTNSKSKPFGPIGTYNGFKHNHPLNKRIDYIFTSKNNIEILKYAILTDSKDLKYPSDHLPVFIEIKIL